MSGNILNFNSKQLQLRLSDSEFYDFYLAKDEVSDTVADNADKNCLVVHYDFNNGAIYPTTASTDTIYSLVTWTGATNTGYTFDTIGLTGIDNGLITFEKDLIDLTNPSLLDALTGTTLVINSGDTRLCMNRVTGITGTYIESTINGDFSNGFTGWDVGGGWTISGDTGINLSAITPPMALDSEITQIFNQPLEIGSKYKLTIDIISIVSGNTFNIFSNVTGITQTITSAGYYDLEFDLINEVTPVSALTMSLSGFSTIGIQIDNVSLSKFTPNLVYPLEEVVDSGTSQNYMNFCGGFYQGYYKIDGSTYEVLPNRVPKSWTAEFWLKKSDTNCVSLLSGETTLNDLYPDNKGIFWYLGTRAENKFWNQFEGINTGSTSGCTSGATEWCTIPKEFDISVIDDASNVAVPLNPPPILITEITNQFLIYGRARSGSTWCNNEVTGLGSKLACSFTGSSLFVTSTVQLQTEVRNPFLIFSRASGISSGPCGTNTSGVRGITACNYSGDSVDMTELDWKSDVIDNAIGFRIKDDGSIGYRLLTVSGECVNGVTTTGCSIEESYSLSGTVTDDVWTHISIRFVLNSTYDECELETKGPRKGKLMFYVNCKLKHVVDDVDEFIARRLNAGGEHWKKQIGVPFNMSLGGGTQGLLESMTFDGQDPDDNGLCIQENFAGSFIGGISEFKFNICNLNWCELQERCNAECMRYGTCTGCGTT